MRAFSLSVHAAYRCAHSGACCTAGWPIPIEAESARRVRALDLMPHTVRPLFDTLQPPVNGCTLRTTVTSSGACVFFEPHGGRLCAIHRVAGADLMPGTCRNFPRIARRDPRGVFVTLSHYCPTAAGLLLNAGTISIVGAPASLTLDGAVEGLDATSVMPPLLRPDMLMDWEGYDRWERESIAVLNDSRLTAARALATIEAATLETQRWRPGLMSLVDHVERAFETTRAAAAPEAIEPDPLDRPTKAFLAAHLFASWAAFSTTGLTAVVDAVRTAFGCLTPVPADAEGFVATVRRTDLLLRHQVETPTAA